MRIDVSRTMMVTGRSEARLRSRELRRARFDFLRGRATRSLQAKRGGARRDRTDDLMLAKHALSQLSYGPVTRRRMPQGWLEETHALDQVVGLGRLELPTSRLSSARSNQLSYKPQRSPYSRDRGLHGSHPAQGQTRRTAQPLARVRPRRKRNEDGEIPPMELNRSGDLLAPECF